MGEVVGETTELLLSLPLWTTVFLLPNRPLFSSTTTGSGAGAGGGGGGVDLKNGMVVGSVLNEVTAMKPGSKLGR